MEVVTLEDTAGFLIKIREALARGFDGSSENYLDLALEVPSDPSRGFLTGSPPVNGLAIVHEIMMKEIYLCHLDHIKLGINELLKHLLAFIHQDNEHILSKQHLYRLHMIFRRCLLADFPFPEEIWNYICDCMRSAGSFMIAQGFYVAAREIIDSLAQIGRIAALKGMPTANTQACLRILENKALEKEQKQLASIAKNARFNLET